MLRYNVYDSVYRAIRAYRLYARIALYTLSFAPSIALSR